MGKPKIRFKGYTEDWEQRKLGEVCSRVQGNDGRMDLPTLTISAANGWMNQEERFSGNIAGKEQKNYTLLHKGELSYNHGNSKLAKYGTVFSLQSYKEALVPRVYHSFKVEEGSPDFLEYYFATKLPDRELGKLISSGARMDGLLNIGYNEFMGIQMLFPSVEEQKQISNYFRTLDYLITLHQRKCDETKKLKKCMLQKMFPKEGEKVPEIRFSGFTGDWKQRKLGEVFEQTTNFVNPDKGEIELWSLTVEDGLTPKSERYNREFLVKKNANFKKVRPGDIVYNPMNMTLGAVGYNGMLKNVAVSGYYITMFVKTGYDSYYINTWLKSPQALSLYKTFATGSLIEKQRVQFSTLSIIPTVFPEYEEQKRIGCYFNNLDSLITFHQQKCDELKNIKKFMLQNMFVSEK